MLHQILVISMFEKRKCQYTSPSICHHATACPVGAPGAESHSTGLWLSGNGPCSAAVATNSVTFAATNKGTGYVADVILRLYVESARPTDTPCLDWALDNQWSLVLCGDRTFDAWRGVEGGHHVRPLLMFREGRFPAAYKDGYPTDFLPGRTILGLVGKRRLPELQEAGVANLIQIVQEGILFGVHGASLHWGERPGNWTPRNPLVWLRR